MTFIPLLPIRQTTKVKKKSIEFSDVILIEESTKRKFKILAWDDFIFIYDLKTGIIEEIAKNNLTDGDYYVKDERIEP